MSLSTALYTAVAGVRAQSAAISAVSENIANSNTTAYKQRTIDFASMVTNSASSSRGYASGSVYYRMGQNMGAQGNINTTNSGTDIAIQGNGFFVVSDATDNKPSAYNYSRNGHFSTDSSGYLVNDEGYYLMGQRTDASGKVTAANKNDLNSLEPINVNTVKGTAKATTNASMDMNLPADAAVGASFSSAIEVFDSLGVSHTIDQTWTKTAANTWTLSMDDPYLTSDSTATSGTLTPSTVDITFDGNGKLASTNPNPIALSITGFTSGASNSSVTLDLGTIGGTDGLTQFASTKDTPDLEISNIDQNGLRYGELSSIEIGDNGIVTAVFDNGLRQSIYQVPIATFANPNGLTHINGSVYDENQLAGNYNLGLPGGGSAGTIKSSALEGSAVDISDEFNKMIIAQQAYSAASQVISTSSDLFDTLIQSVR